MFRNRELFSLNKKILNFGGYLVYFRRKIMGQLPAKLFMKNKEILEGRTSDVCYICALGPSLADINFSALNGDTIVVNKFYKMKQTVPDFNPTYYLMVDYAFVDSELESVKNALITYPDTKFILNTRFLENDYVKSLDKQNIYFLGFVKGSLSDNKELNLLKAMPALGNVASCAIGFAIATGYKKIILLGCDFNSFASQKSVHCYNEDDDKRSISLGFELFCYAFAADIHVELSKYAEKHKVKIINATRGSLIDAYERIDMPDLYNVKKKDE